MSPSQLLPRQTVITDYPDGSWWYSSEAYIIKWCVVGGLVLLFLAFVMGGYIHLQRRIKKGQTPLRYHRWLLSRQQRARFFPDQGANTYYYRHGQWARQEHGQAYPMQPWAPGPPAYNENEYVPTYTPPQGASKVNPDQSYAPPSGPPPPAATYGNPEASRAFPPTHAQAGPSQTVVTK